MSYIHLCLVSSFLQLRCKLCSLCCALDTIYMTKCLFYVENYPFISLTSESRGWTKGRGVNLALAPVAYTPLLEGFFCYQNSPVSRLNSKYLTKIKQEFYTTQQHSVTQVCLFARDTSKRVWSFFDPFKSPRDLWLQPKLQLKQFRHLKPQISQNQL